MDERVVQFRVGVMVLATAIITAVLVVLFGKLPTLVRGTYTIYVNFKDAPGVSADSPVRKSGILIGRVAKTELTDDGVLVTARINSDVKLRQSEEVRISGSLLGDASLQIVPIPAIGTSDKFVENGEYMAGSVAPDPIQTFIKFQERMENTVDRLGSAGTEVANLARNANNFLTANDENFNRIVTKTERTIEDFQKAIAHVDDLVGDPKVKAALKESLQQVPELLADARKTVQGMQDTVTTATGALSSLQNNLKNFEGLTEPLRDNGGNIVANMDRGLEHLNRTLSQLDQFTTNLNNSEGTISRLVNDPELYHQLVRAAQNVNEITREVKPIVRDARTLVKKVTQHPGVFLRDAVKPGSGLTGVSPVGYWDLERQCWVEEGK